MTPHKILKTFKGSQDGRITETFEQGTVRDLSDSLAVAAVAAGDAEPTKAKATRAPENKGNPTGTENKDQPTDIEAQLAAVSKLTSKKKIAEFVKLHTGVELDQSVKPEVLLEQAKAELTKTNEAKIAADIARNQ